MDTIDRYSTPEAIEGAFRLALTRSQVEARYLNIKASEMELYQEMLSHLLFISPMRRQFQEIIMQNRKGQPSLWPYGISGDLPVVLVILKKSDEVDTLYEVLKMHEYWHIKEVKADLVILNDEENSYTHPLSILLSDIIAASHAHEMINKPGGVYVLNWNNMPEEDINLLYAVSRLVLKGDGGLLPDQVKRLQANQLPKFRRFTDEKRNYPHSSLIQPELKFFNGIGGFIPDGSEYVVFLGKSQTTPMPWVNVISNPRFGFISTEAGSGYTWCENSRENKLTPWSNDPVSDTPGEIIYTSDTDTSDIWSVTTLPVRDDQPYLVRHGFGYSVYEHESHGIFESLVQFVPLDDTAKISILKVKNVSDYQRNLSLTYYIRPVAGVSDNSSAMHIRTVTCENGALLFENPYNEEFGKRIGIVDVSEKERSFTCDRKEFFGMGKLSSPDSL
jgi:cellobiose phosphorylase